MNDTRIITVALEGLENILKVRCLLHGSEGFLFVSGVAATLMARFLMSVVVKLHFGYLIADGHG